MNKLIYGIQVWYNNEWIWVTTSANNSQESRLVSTFTDIDQATCLAKTLNNSYNKTRIVKIDHDN